MAQFAVEHPVKFNSWHEIGKNLVVLSTTNEKQLLKLSESFLKHGLAHTVFREPDIGNKVTALAVEPNEVTYKLTASLPLTMKESKQGKTLGT